MSKALHPLKRRFKKIFFRNKLKTFRTSGEFWETRYNFGGNSGKGSYGKLAEFKAEIINQFVKDHKIKTVIEYGCGDGNQLKFADYPAYTGFDVAQTAVDMCKSVFANDHTKAFKNIADYDGERADLTLSLDVIYHLIEDPVFNNYMTQLFDSADRYVIIYSSNYDDAGQAVDHVKHRQFTKWIAEHRCEWQLIQKIDNKYPFIGNNKTGSRADFFIYKKKS